ncbi:MAG: Gfo/Idh/MocA family oxidoreductase [Verrucomicrobiota bacterium]|nr:Gfo/Idh/MocA family oxidoreductase [Verrucomicrobiota bacterium]
MMKNKQEKTRMTRRRFIGAGAAAAFGFQVVSSRVFGANSRLAVAGIGAGGKGRADISGAVDAGADIVALCDVDESRAAGMFKAHPKAKRFPDFRVMLEKMGGSIDACTISTPDHTHAAATSMAMKMGKHCYTQKPLTHDVYEARHLTRLAKRTGVATQMGNQAHAGEPIRRAVELVRAGIIGNVTEAHIWTNRPIWPQGMKARPAKTDVPKGLDWDLWLGPAPHRPYGKGYVPFAWRGWWDFGTGALGDMACHIMDMAWWSLDLGAPTSVSARHGGNTAESAPNWAVIDYQFGYRGSRPPVKLVWYDGKKSGVQNAPSLEITGGVQMVGKGGKGYGTVLIGDKGRMFFSRRGTGWRITGRDADEVKQIEANTPRTIPRTEGNYAEWVNAATGNGHAPLSRFEVAGPFTEMVLLGNLAIRAAEPVHWDAEALRSTNSDKANRYVRGEYRTGWKL